MTCRAHTLKIRPTVCFVFLSILFDMVIYKQMLCPQLFCFNIYSIFPSLNIFLIYLKFFLTIYRPTTMRRIHFAALVHLVCHIDFESAIVIHMVEHVIFFHSHTSDLGTVLRSNPHQNTYNHALSRLSPRTLELITPHAQSACVHPSTQ